MLVAQVMEDGSVAGMRRYPTGQVGKEKILEILFDGIEDFEAQTGWLGGERPVRIGIGVNGVIDPVEGVWKKMGAEDKELALRDRVEERYGLRCYVDNDVKSTVIAENVFGAGKGCRDMVYINVGTGLAAGVISNGKIIRGTDAFAGEVGFMNFTEGKGERVEMLASGMGIRHQARRLLEEYPDSVLGQAAESGVTGEQLFRAVRQGDEMGVRIYRTFIEMTGLMISNLVCVLSPEIVVLGGGLIKDGEVLDAIRAAVLPKAAQHLEKGVVLTGLDSNLAGLMGAAAIGLGYQERYQ